MQLVGSIDPVPVACTRLVMLGGNSLLLIRSWAQILDFDARKYLQFKVQFFFSNALSETDVQLMSVPLFPVYTTLPGAFRS